MGECNLDETFRCFAYGSNMLTRRLRARTPSARAVGVGYVRGHRLTFDKVSRDGSGKCDMEHGEETNRVYGVVFDIALAERTDLERAEGVGAGYEAKEVDVALTDDTIRAIAYVATAKEPALRPYNWYKAFVVAGAVEHGLPMAYVEWLRTVESLPDPNVTRRSREEAILFGGDVQAQPEAAGGPGEK